MSQEKESPEENWGEILDFQRDYIPISSAVRFKFQLKYPYDWWLKNDLDVVDDYGNLK